MFFDSWRRKRKLKKFRPIASLHMDPTAHYGFHPVLLKPKTICRQVKTSVIHKEEHIHHLHHEMSMHVHQAQTILMMKQDKEGSRYLLSSRKTVNRMYPTKNLKFVMSHTSWKRLAEQRMLEEKNYYKYHPTKARELANDYLQNTETLRALSSYMHKDSYTGRRKSGIYHSSVFTTISSGTWKQVLMPVLKKQSRELIHLRKEPVQKPQEPILLKEEPKVDKVPLEIKDRPIDTYSLIQAVVCEVERKMKRERLRKGRRE